MDVFHFPFNSGVCLSMCVCGGVCEGQGVQSHMKSIMHVYGKKVRTHQGEEAGGVRDDNPLCSTNDWMLHLRDKS